MFTSDQVQQLRELSTTAQSILVILPANPTQDQAASGLALFHALQALGKSVSLLSPQNFNPELQQLAGAENVSTQLGNRDLNV